MAEAFTVRREVQIAAPPATVFAFLTDPEKILRWMGTEAKVEPHPGGIYLVNVTGARFARGSFRPSTAGPDPSMAGPGVNDVSGQRIEQLLRAVSTRGLSYCP